jgi:hypothetical protein
MPIGIQYALLLIAFAFHAFALMWLWYLLAYRSKAIVIQGAFSGFQPSDEESGLHDGFRYRKVVVVESSYSRSKVIVKGVLSGSTQ